MRIMLEADPADTMPWISDQIRQLQPPVPRSLPDYAKIKTYFNTILLEMEPMLKNAIEQEVDPMLCGFPAAAITSILVLWIMWMRTFCAPC